MGAGQRMWPLLLLSVLQERLADVKREAFQLNRQAAVNETRYQAAQGLCCEASTHMFCRAAQTMHKVATMLALQSNLPL